MSDAPDNRLDDDRNALRVDGESAGPVAGRLPEQDRSVVRTVPIESIRRSPYRSLAPTPGAAEIAAGLSREALCEGVLVRPGSQGGYELLVGERVWRLAQAVRYDALPVRVLERVDDDLARFLAAVDAHRDAERATGVTGAHGRLPWSGEAKLAMARAIDALVRERGWRASQAASLFGLSRTEGAHYVRVLKLPAPVLGLLAQGALSFGQARALSPLADWPARARLLAAKVAAVPGTAARGRRRAYSVREVERLVAETLRQIAGTGEDRAAAAAEGTVRAPAADRSAQRASGDLRRAERLLGERCGFPVEIRYDARSQRGRLIVRFASIDEFQTLAGLLAPGIDFEDG